MLCYCVASVTLTRDIRYTMTDYLIELLLCSIVDIRHRFGEVVRLRNQVVGVEIMFPEAIDDLFGSGNALIWCHMHHVLQLLVVYYLLDIANSASRVFQKC